ncbi:hypothetical protein A0H81_11221 [Grifola frondosa]|uniref:Uncharacterized protein n=1 Tax=Grifola frondosa TaxID=5627 RepID=A0A1C7M1A0_GRIFR|nr:hypothetical protein A0H81_11221 [Grifola frondosa]
MHSPLALPYVQRCIRVLDLFWIIKDVALVSFTFEHSSIKGRLFLRLAMASSLPRSVPRPSGTVAEIQDCLALLTKLVPSSTGRSSVIPSAEDESSNRISRRFIARNRHTGLFFIHITSEIMFFKGLALSAIAALISAVSAREIMLYENGPRRFRRH